MEQTDNHELFIIDKELTFINPSPPKLGEIVNFELAGTWTETVHIDHINFKCRMFGALIYNRDIRQFESVEPGEWKVPNFFDVPKVAPPTTYVVTMSGIAQD